MSNLLFVNETDFNDVLRVPFFSQLKPIKARLHCAQFSEHVVLLDGLLYQRSVGRVTHGRLQYWFRKLFFLSITIRTEFMTSDLLISYLPNHVKKHLFVSLSLGRLSRLILSQRSRDLTSKTPSEATILTNKSFLGRC